MMPTSESRVTLKGEGLRNQPQNAQDRPKLHQLECNFAKKNSDVISPDSFCGNGSHLPYSSYREAGKHLRIYFCTRPRVIRARCRTGGDSVGAIRTGGQL